jgi:flagellar basal body P-ring formation protein FlgA
MTLYPAPRTESPVTSLVVGILATAVLLILNSTSVRAQADVPARNTVRVTWPRAVHALPRGQTITPADFVLVDTVITWKWNSTPDTVRAIAGWVTRRAIAAGEFLRAPGVAPASVITMGSVVKVLWQDGALRLTLTGTATNNAALGAPVGVRIDRNRRLDGIAVGPNTVRLR